MAGLRRGDLTSASRLLQMAPRDEVWRARLTLARAELLLARGDGEGALPLLSSRAPTDNLEGRRQMLRADALIKLGRTADAQAALDAADALRPRLSDPEVPVEIDIRRGGLLTIAGDIEPAVDVLTRALEGALELDSYWLEASAANQLAVNRIRVFRYDAALTFGEHALHKARTAGLRRLEGSALANMSICYGRLGDFDKARESAGTAIRLLEQVGDRRALQATLGLLGNVHMLERDAGKAIPCYRRAIEIARELNAASYVTYWRANLAEALVDAGDWAAAEALNREMHGRDPQTLDQQTRISARLTEAAIAAGRKRYDDAIAAYTEVIAAGPTNPGQRWHAHAGLGETYAQTGKTDEAAREFETAIGLLESTRAGLVASEHRLTFLSQLTRSYQSYVELLMTRGDHEEAFLVSERSRARMLAERFETNLPAATTARLDQYVAASRRLGVRFVSYWTAPRRSFLWVIAPDGLHSYVLPPSAEIASLVRAHLDSITGFRDPVVSGGRAGARLYNVLLAPAGQAIPDRATVVIVPDGPLLDLNFETLPTPAGRYWLEHATVSISPAASVALRAPRHARRASPVLLVGDADAVGQQYPKLPYAREEIESVQRRFNASDRLVLSGAQANPIDYRAANPGRFSIIHFAAHGLANRLNPLDSAIVLSVKHGSYLLHARDIMQQDLSAEVVTMAACRSAGSKSYPGEGLVGLAWAFLHAGARNVVATLWDVSDRSTAHLMSLFYAKLATGATPAQALHEAKLEFIRSTPQYRKPWYWAAFQHYIGAGRKPVTPAPGRPVPARKPPAT